MSDKAIETICSTVGVIVMIALWLGWMAYMAVHRNKDE